MHKRKEGEGRRIADGDKENEMKETSERKIEG